METTYASGVARCDSWKAFVSVPYSKCETGANAGILYIAIRQYTTSHEGYPSGAKTFVWLKEFDAKIYFRAT